MAPIQIIEVLGPIDQGRTRPYRCRGDDDQIYYVKGRQTNRASLWHEWICGHLAQSFGLNLAPFSLVEISDELMDEVGSDWRELGSGIAFGSRQHLSATWLEPSMADMVSIDVQRDVLAFDWWIHNGDRLTYNSNLLWDASTDELVVIDHNLAFDPDFSSAEFLEHHIFAKQWPAIAEDLVSRDGYCKRMASALSSSWKACDNAPEEWLWANKEMDVLADFSLPRVEGLLRRCATDELWRLV